MDMAKPIIRFKGYQDDWEQRKVSELCSISTGKSNTQDKVEDGEYPFYVRSPIIERSTKYLYDEEAVITVGDGVGTGKVFHYVNGKYDLHQRCYRMYGFSDELNAHYFYHTFSKLFYKRVMAMTAKTSVDSVRLEMISDMKIPVPNVEEQRKIGNLLDGIDNLITLHQRKCDETKRLKKYLLQKMFPQNGEKVPEIRFSGFTDDWEQRKLGDVAQEFKSGTSLKADEIDITGDYPVYGGNGLRGYTSTYNHDGEYALIGRQGALCGNMNYSVGKAYFTEHAVVVKADENNDTMFLYYMLDTMNLGQYSDQSAQPGLAVNKLVKLENWFPTKEEQQRIGWYFSNLDHLITLHQRELENFQNIKRFMLGKMFV